MITFTPEQQAALDLHIHCAVHANAGSGKTSVVTYRFVKILVETGVPLDQIIAITFTRAAAAEMRERVHRLLNDALHSPEIRASFASSLSDDELCRKLRQWAIAISSARISTFHSFCAGLVRQYAEELELDAELGDIEGAEAAALIDDAVRRTIAEHLTVSSSSHHAVTSMFDDVSVDVVRAILTRATADTTFAEVLGASADASALNERSTVVNALQLQVAMQALRLISEILAPIRDLPKIRPLADLAQVLATQCCDPGSAGVAGRIAELYDKLFTGKHILRDALIPKGEPSDPSIRSIAPRELTESVSVLKTPWNAIQEQRLQSILETLQLMATSAREHYRQAKRERNVIDFDDMIQLTLDLLKDATVTAAVRASVRYIMVDEFQDTDPLQYGVLSRLAPALLGEDAPVPNVCIVGDDKQSIYGFRNADVRLFRRATYALQRANRHRGDDTGYRPLTTSFRMHESIAQRVNAICSAMFGEVDPPPITDTTSFDVAYQPLRSVPCNVELEHVGICSVLTDDDEHGNDDISPIADLVVNILHGRIRRDIAVFDKATHTWSTRPPTPSDIAVLVQNNKQVLAVGEALSLLRVPADVHGGGSFFQRPEIADIRALLRVCIDPSDDLALATLCRSPLLRCTDSELATAALLGRRTSMRDGLAQCVADGQASSNLVRAHTLITDWDLAGIRMSPTDLIQHALDTSDWYAMLELDDRREQIIANVEKAFEIIRSAVDATGGTLYDALAALSPLNGDRERDGVVLSQTDAVRVMTIHVSKGLEFGIVIIGGLSAGTRRSTYITSDDIGVTFPIATSEIDPESPGTLTDLPPLASYAVASFADARREQAEYRRRLYVALTRASSHVVIVRGSGKKKATKGMASVLESALSAAEQYIRIDQHQPSAPYEGSGTDRETCVLLDHLAAPLPDLVAPSQFVQHNRWIDDDARRVERETAGAAYGVAVHDVLATVLPSALDADESERIGMIARALAVHQLDRERAAEAVMEIVALFDTPLVKNHTDLLRRSRREVRLVGALDDTVLQGILDCRLSHADGTISVWDWKTNAVQRMSDLDDLARLYLPQMRIYAWLCFRAYPECASVTTRLVFTKAVVRGIEEYDRSIQWRRAQLSEMEADVRSSLADLLARSNGG